MAADPMTLKIGELQQTVIRQSETISGYQRIMTDQLKELKDLEERITNLRLTDDARMQRIRDLEQQVENQCRMLEESKSHTQIIKLEMEISALKDSLVTAQSVMVSNERLKAEAAHEKATRIKYQDRMYAIMGTMSRHQWIGDLTRIHLDNVVDKLISMFRSLLDEKSRLEREVDDLRMGKSPTLATAHQGPAFSIKVDHLCDSAAADNRQPSEQQPSEQPSERPREWWTLGEEYICDVCRTVVGYAPAVELPPGWVTYKDGRNHACTACVKDLTYAIARR